MTSNGKKNLSNNKRRKLSDDEWNPLDHPASYDVRVTQSKLSSEQLKRFIILSQKKAEVEFVEAFGDEMCFVVSFPWTCKCSTIKERMGSLALATEVSRAGEKLSAKEVHELAELEALVATLPEYGSQNTL
jgi:hypothetical protein